MVEGVAGGVPWNDLRAIAAGVVSAPTTAALIALGAGVLIGRSLVDGAGQMWQWLPSLGWDERGAEAQGAEGAGSRKRAAAS